jgi:hypothetical protein
MTDFLLARAGDVFGSASLRLQQRAGLPPTSPFASPAFFLACNFYGSQR